MKLHHKAVAADTKAIADQRQVRVIVSTSDLDRVGDVVVQDGIDLTAYRANPVVLWQHDRDEPIARCAEISIDAGKLTALVQFPPEGVSPEADKTYGLILAGVINAASIGFAIKASVPLDPNKPFGGLRITASELYEFSFVSVPAVRQALVIERSEHAMKFNTKGLYEVGWLAYMLGELGCLSDWVSWEAGYEADNSQVPAMLYSAIQQLGVALVAMTQEEVSELLADLAAQVPPVVVDDADDEIIDDPDAMLALSALESYRKYVGGQPIVQRAVEMAAAKAVPPPEPANTDVAAAAKQVRAFVDQALADVATETVIERAKQARIRAAAVRMRLAGLAA